MHQLAQTDRPFHVWLRRPTTPFGTHTLREFWADRRRLLRIRTVDQGDGCGVRISHVAALHLRAHAPREFTFGKKRGDPGLLSLSVFLRSVNRRPTPTIAESAPPVRVAGLTACPRAWRDIIAGENAGLRPTFQLGIVA